MEIELTSQEVSLVASILRFASDVDRRYASVCAIVQDGEVNWVATDNTCLALLSCGKCDQQSGVVAIPKRVFFMGEQIARARQPQIARVRLRSESSGILMLPGITIPFESKPNDILGVVDVARKLGDSSSRLHLARDDFEFVVRAVSSRPLWLAKDALRRFVLRPNSDNGTLEVSAEWVGHPDTTAFTTCQSDASAALVLDPARLLDVAAVTTEGRIEIGWGADSGSPVWLSSPGGPAVMIMPGKSTVEWMRPQFEAILAELLDVEPGQVYKDEDDDYPLALRDVQAYITLEPGDEARRVHSLVRIYVALTDGIEESLDALQEINQQNQRRPFARLYLQDGVLFLETELALDGVSKPQLRAAIDAFEDAAREVLPWMQAFFGKPAPPREKEDPEIDGD